MKISIIPDDHGYCEKWTAFLQERGHEVLPLEISTPKILEQIASTDGFMWRPSLSITDKQIAHRLLLIVEKYLNIPVYPDFNTYWHHDDKVAQHYLFQALNIPTPETRVFWIKEQALDWARVVNYPVVHKSAVGASSINVSLIKSFNEAKNVIDKDFYGYYSRKRNPFQKINRESIWYLKTKFLTLKKFLFDDIYPIPSKNWEIEKNYCYFQEFLKDNPFDTRVTVIGNRAFAFRRWNREKDFRASGSGKLDYDLSAIDHRCLRLAFDVSKKCNFQSMAYDILFKDNQPVIGEISHSYLDKAVFNCPGYWDRNLVWHEGHIWPEEAQVDDFLDRILKRKAIST